MAWEDSPSSGLHPNLEKFLGFLGKAEGADYNTIVGGSSFSDFSRHPAVVGLRTKEGPSTAAGRYQITKTTYDDVAPRLGITDFSQKSQDLIAAELIRRKGALEDILSGNFDSAINKLGGTWASLPSSPYSQPKRDWNFVKANLTASNAGWEDAPDAPKASSGGGWEDAPEPVKAAPAPAPAPAGKPAAAAPAPASNPMRGLSIGTRDVLEGAEKAFTYPVRATSDFIAGLVGLAGGGDTQAYKILTQMGLKGRGAGAMAADAAGLAKPETQAEKIVSAGVQAASGLYPGTVVNQLAGLTPAAPVLARQAASILTPGTSGTAGQVAKDAAIFGGLGAAMEAAPAETAAGLAVLAGGKAAAGKAMTNRAADKIISKAGGNEAARMDAEIIDDIARLAKNPNQRGNPITAAQLNAIETKYVSEVNDALGKLPKSPEISSIRAAIQNRRALTPDDLIAIRGTDAGDAAAAAIEKAQRARSMTQAMQSSGGLMPMLREGVDYLPVPAAINRGLKALLGGRQTREIAAQKVLKKEDAAKVVLDRLGPSEATQANQRLLELAQQAQAARQAQVTAGQAARTGRVAKEANPQVAISELQAKDPTYILGLSNRLGAPRNADEMTEFSKVIKAQMEARAARAAAGQEKSRLAAEIAKGPQVDPRIQVLQDTRRPLSGAFQELLPGGRSNLNLTSQEAIDALRLTSRQFKDRPVGQAAQDILRSGNVSDEAAFYGLQNQLRKLQENGILGNRAGGALSEATAASPIRNPISYAEAVRTAGAAADLARANAPSKELAQFATRVAGIKSPEAKAKAIADRLAKSSDPAEQAFLTQFVEPLAQFGKK